MQSRRSLLAALVAACIPWPPLAGSAGAVLRPAGEGFRVVDGWILTEADIRALGRA